MRNSSITIALAIAGFVAGAANITAASAQSLDANRVTDYVEQLSQKLAATEGKEYMTDYVDRLQQKRASNAGRERMTHYIHQLSQKLAATDAPIATPVAATVVPVTTRSTMTSTVEPQSNVSNDAARLTGI